VLNYGGFPKIVQLVAPASQYKLGLLSDEVRLLNIKVRVLLVWVPNYLVSPIHSLLTVYLFVIPGDRLCQVNFDKRPDSPVLYTDLFALKLQNGTS